MEARHVIRCCAARRPPRCLMFVSSYTEPRARTQTARGATINSHAAHYNAAPAASLPFSVGDSPPPSPPNGHSQSHTGSGRQLEGAYYAGQRSPLTPVASFHVFHSPPAHSLATQPRPRHTAHSQSQYQSQWPAASLLSTVDLSGAALFPRSQFPSPSDAYPPLPLPARSSRARPRPSCGYIVSRAAKHWNRWSRNFRAKRGCSKCVGAIRTLVASAVVLAVLGIVALLGARLFRAVIPPSPSSTAGSSCSSVSCVLFPPPLLPPASFLTGYDPPNALTVLEDEDAAFARLYAARDCDEFDLLCAARKAPLSTLRGRPSDLSAVNELRYLVFLLLSDASFVDLALNLICSADAQGVDRAHWLIVATDATAFRFFTLRGLNVVRLKQARVSVTPKQGGDWGSTSHIAINREKIPLMHTLLSHHVDVMVMDADLVFLAPLPPLIARDWLVDIEVMHDYPYGLLTSLYTPEAAHCIRIKDAANTPPACAYLWELNGGLMLLRASRLTVRLVEDAFDWLQKNPTSHDQDALRFLIKQRFYLKQLTFIDNEGRAWPSHVPSAEDGSLALRYFPPLLAPNGGLFFFEGRAMYQDAAASAGINAPVLLHVNWIVGQQRKVTLMRQHGLLFTTGNTGAARCSTINTATVICKRNDSAKETTTAPTPGEWLIEHRSDHFPRLSRTTLNALQRAVLESAINEASTALAMEAPLQPSAMLPRPPSGPPLLLIFSSPKPIASYLTLPSVARSPDADGVGARPAATDLSAAEREALRLTNALQLRAQLACLTSWFALADARNNFAHVALLSHDRHHGDLADRLSFDWIDQYDEDEFGAPKLHSVFKIAELLAARRSIPFCLYTNGDLAFGQDLRDTLRAIESYQFAEVLAVGQRQTFNPRFLEHAPDDYQRMIEELVTAIQKNEVLEPEAERSFPKAASLSRSTAASLFAGLAGKSHRAGLLTALDYFLFTRNFWDWREIPRFLLGRVAFDNYLLHWANSRKSATVIDVSLTVSAIHMDHNHTQSWGAPNGFNNARLAGNPVHSGLGSLEHVQFRTVRLSTGEIRVVRALPPTNSQLGQLFETATAASIELNGRPTVMIVTADAAFARVLQNWLLTFRRARGDTYAGLLVVSVAPEATDIARRLSLPCFELTTDERAIAYLNGDPTAYLQILSLRAKAIQFLLEFGFDVLNLHLDYVYVEDPLTLINRKAYQYQQPQAEEEEEEDVHRMIDRDHGSTPLPTEWYGDGLDLVAFTYLPHSVNVSMGGLFLRHTPECLRVWRRISAQLSALRNRATQAMQINLYYLDEDWYLAFELRENDRLRFGLIDAEPRTELLRMRTWTEYRRGSLHDADVVERRMQAAGVWMLEDGRSDNLFREPANVRPMRTLQDYQPLPSLTSELKMTEREQRILEATQTQSRALSPTQPIARIASVSVSLMELTGNNSATVQSFLERANSLALCHILVVAESELTARALLPAALVAAFPVLYRPPGLLAPRAHFAVRVSQLLTRGLTVVVVDPEAVWFDQPLNYIDDGTADRFRSCDVNAMTHRHQQIDDGLVVLRPTEATRALLADTHRCVSAPEADAFRGCLLASARMLQSVGLLSVCALDSAWFPSSHAMFESGAAMDGGTWPVVSPPRFVQPQSGRVKEFVRGFQQLAKATHIRPPELSQHHDDDTDSSSAGTGAGASTGAASDWCRCPVTHSSSTRPRFHLTIRVLSFTRAASLSRLLASLNGAEFGSDRVTLEIAVDAATAPARASGGNFTAVTEARARVLEVSESFVWQHGTKRVLVHDEHRGLVGQWLSAFAPAPHEDTHFALVLEDDLELSPEFYHFLRLAICQYYMNPRQFDPHLFGISLQHQRHVVGLSQKNAATLRAAREHAAQQNASGSDQDGATVLGVDGMLAGHHVWRYQLVGTWGLLLFPNHWREFLQWYSEKSTVASFTPCVPFLESSQWWQQRPHAVWSQWLIRFAFERGWYCLYYRHEEPVHLTLALNHREVGENYRVQRGPDASGLVPRGQLSVTASSLPNLAATPLLDFHGRAYGGNGRGLAQRSLLLTARHWKDACRAPRFEPNEDKI